MRFTAEEISRLESRRLAIKKLYQRTYGQKPHYNSYLAELWLKLRSVYPEDKQYHPNMGLGVILDKMTKQIQKTGEVDWHALRLQSKKRRVV